MSDNPENKDDVSPESIVLDQTDFLSVDAGAKSDPGIARGALFEGDSVAFLTAKNTTLEAMFALLTRNLKFNDFVREILLVLMKTVKSEAGSVLEIDHRDSMMFFRAVVGQSSESIAQFKVPLGKGIAGYVAESLQPLVVNDIRDNPIHMKAIANAVNFETRNLIALPVVVRGKAFGVVELLNRVGDNGYSQQDLELLSSLCETAARAIEIRLMLAWSQSGQAAPPKGEAA